MIAGEHKFVLIEQDHVAARVTGNRNRDQIFIDPNRIAARDYLLDPEAGSAIVRMHDPSTSKLLSKALMIGDVVFVREKHRAHAAHRLDLLYKLGSEPR